MTEELQRALDRQLDEALESGDAMRISRAQANILKSLMDCQRKTAERVKRLGWKFTVAMAALGAGGGVTAVKWDLISKLIFGAS